MTRKCLLIITSAGSSESRYPACKRRAGVSGVEKGLLCERAAIIASSMC